MEGIFGGLFVILIIIFFIWVNRIEAQEEKARQKRIADIQAQKLADERKVRAEREKEKAKILADEQNRLANIEAQKLADKKKAEAEHLRKIEEEKYETLLIVSTSISADEKHHIVLKREDNTFAYADTSTHFTINSKIKLTKEKVKTFTWISESKFHKIKEQLRLKEESINNEKVRLYQEHLKVNRLALQENGTTYANAITKIMHPIPNFWKVYEHNISSTAHLHFTTIFDSLNNGTVIIEDPQTLVNYMASYGGHHYQKLQTSYSALFNVIPNDTKVDIIDYGCGQALATNILYDYMINNNKNLLVDKIILIEPSQLALKRGVLKLNYFINYKNQHTEIFEVIKPLDALIDADLSTTENNIKIHLFSNIIDVIGFDYVAFAQKIKATQKGINYFICVSPFNGTAQSRISGFQNCFVSQNIPCVSEIINRKVFDIMTRQWNENYRITMFQRIFKCNF